MVYSLQHRGQESSGIVTTDGTHFYSHKGEGLVAAVYSEATLETLKGSAAIGHNRYSTSSGDSFRHAQPVNETDFALAHNGNIPSVQNMLHFLQEKNIETTNLNDSALMARVIQTFLNEGESLTNSIKKMYTIVSGAFSCVILTKDSLVAFRDPWGIRPLSIGRRQNIGEHYTYFVVSETCALDTVGAEYIRDVEPGEMIQIREGKDGFTRVESIQISTGISPKFDIFEFVYFARHDSVLLGQSVYEVRKNFGKLLAQERKIDVDVVIPVPETAIPAALGYSEESKVPFEFGLTKNRYIHRTFIQPTQNDRDTKVRMKLLPLKCAIKDKRVAVIDDSIVRGTTSKRIVKMLFEAGAAEVHFLVTSAPIRYPDFYGIDTPNQKELIASDQTIAQIKDYLGVTSLTYLSVDNMIKATGLPRDRLCLASFTGEYPIPLFEKEKTFSRNVPQDQLTLEHILGTSTEQEVIMQ